MAAIFISMLIVEARTSKRAPENVREPQDIVDLVRVIGTTGRDDRVLAHLGQILGPDLGVRVGHCKHDRLGGHRPHHVSGKGPLGRQPERHVRALQGIRQCPRAGPDGVARFPLVEPVPPLIDDPGAIAQNDAAWLAAHGLEQFGAGDPRRAGAVDHDARVLERSPGQIERVQQPGHRDDRRSVLIVMKDRDVQCG